MFFDYILDLGAFANEPETSFKEIKHRLEQLEHKFFLVDLADVLFTWIVTARPIIRYDSTQCKTSVEAFKYLNDKQNSKEIRMAGFKRLTDAVTQLCHFVDEKDAREAILAIRKHTRIWSPSGTPLFVGKHQCRKV